ncbi:MAG TPA: HAD family phosphatase [Candidatus Fimimorpha faecalis]|uniref:HAD family phosphatase n=1 Tax=Candidatus Fimimorpha faecalis TaxID=2840824 RepID=A0A9D1EEX3_9FIRM|nr:Putative phosphatase [Clostridiales bacterium CHKCI001]HIR88733.1 HAD family phosphatase [Candidatus Fimimorpha faecalis]
MDKKLIFLDIDGTLTEAGSNTPPESALTAIHTAQTLGHKVFLCTGRNLAMLSPLLKYGFDGVIGSAGGYITYREQVIYSCPMTDEQFQHAMTVFKENGVFRTVECADGSYTDTEFRDFLEKQDTTGSNSELIRWRKQLEESLNILPMQEYHGQPVYKIVFMSPTMEAMEVPIRELSDEFNVCIQDPDQYGIVNGELINRQFDKGQGVLRVCEVLGVDIKDTIGFGDSMNDLEMIETVGYGVVMENGSPSLKKKADYICPAVTENGIYQAFEKLGLLNA